MGINVEEWDRKIAEMMTGNLKASPFTESQIEEARRCLMEWAARKGFFAKAGKNDKPQQVRVRELQAFLRACGDPDAEIMDSHAIGVSLGYMMRIPRTPAVFEKKEK